MLKRYCVFFICLAGVLLPECVEAQNQNNFTMIQHGKSVLHDDGTRTESVKDMEKRSISETTFDARGVAIAKKEFVLSSKGEPTKGVIRDGAGNLIANVLFGFDNLGRLREERCVNKNGEVFRRVIHNYDPTTGKALRPQAFDFAVNTPTMKPSSVDYTKRTPPPPHLAEQAKAMERNEQARQVIQPGQQPQVMSASPTGHTQPVRANHNQDAFREAYEKQQKQLNAQKQSPKTAEKKGFFRRKSKD